MENATRCIARRVAFYFVLPDVPLDRQRDKVDLALTNGTC